VRGFLHRAAEAHGPGLVLTHGAGSNCDTALLRAAAAAFRAAGVTVLRCDLPFRQQRPAGPPFPATAAADRAGLRDAVQALRKIARGPIFLGGHSYGGRQASMLAAEEAVIAEALLLLSYPLHPPKKPEQLRTQHFPRLRTRAVFVHGTADPFGSSGEVRAALKLVPAATRLIAIDGAKHDLRQGKFDWAEAVTVLLEKKS
jgi:hypothetical protein